MGGMTCSICTNKAKEAIDQALVAAGSRRTIANQYGLSDAAVGRHRENHLPATLVKAVESRELAHGENLLDRVNGLVDSALASLERAEGKGNEREVQGAIRETRHSLELVGRITGELRDSNRDSAPMTPMNYILLVGKMFSDDELRRMSGGDATPEERERFKTTYRDNVALRTVEGQSHVVEPS